MRCQGCGAEVLTNAAHYCKGSHSVPPTVVMYMAGFPDAPYIPAPPLKIDPDVRITWPPLPVPSGAEQEIGALKERVGRLEKEMREMAAKFLAKGKKR